MPNAVTQRKVRPYTLILLGVLAATFAWMDGGGPVAHPGKRTLRLRYRLS